MSALIVTADFAPADFAWLEGLRRANYPPERNQVPVHLTLFHALPPSAEEEVRRHLALKSTGPAPHATIAGLMDLGGGVAFRVVSDELNSIRDAISRSFSWATRRAGCGGLAAACNDPEQGAAKDGQGVTGGVGTRLPAAIAWNRRAGAAPIHGRPMGNAGALPFSRDLGQVADTVAIDVERSESSASRTEASIGMSINSSTTLFSSVAASIASSQSAAS